MSNCEEILQHLAAAGAGTGWGALWFWLALAFLVPVAVFVGLMCYRDRRVQRLWKSSEGRERPSCGPGFAGPTLAEVKRSRQRAKARREEAAAPAGRV